MSNNVRVRFAPSPTGPLHIGGVRTALYNYLFARKNKGTFILRIEDTDQKRYVKEAEAYIIDSLNWLGIIPEEGPSIGGDFGPYRQSERTEIYSEHIKKLLQDGNAYYAFDTPEELEKKRAENPNWTYNSRERMQMKNSLALSAEEVETLLSNNTACVIRAKIPENSEILINDLIRGEVVFQSKELDDKVLIKKDGLPTYHFANIVDDHLMEISHVIRGEEWVSSAPLHKLLYDFLGWKAPIWVHLPLILKPNGKGKLSKRDGEMGNFPVFPMNWHDAKSESVWPGFKEEGYFPESVVNFLALLGWNPGTEQEFFDMNQLIEAFSLDRISKSGAAFNPDKARWFNKEHLKTKSDDFLMEELKGQFDAMEKPIDLDKRKKIIQLMKERAHFVHEIAQVDFILNSPTRYDEKTIRKKWKENTPALLDKYAKELVNIEPFKTEEIERHFKSFLENNEIGMGALMPNLRVALTGLGGGPSLFQIMEIIGKEQGISRIQKALEDV